MNYFSCEYLAEYLTYLGTPTEAVAVEFAPQLVIYHFNLLDFNKLTRLDKDIIKLAMVTHYQFQRVESDKGHFALTTPRLDREIKRTVCQGHIMKELPQNSILFGFDTQNKPVTATLKDLPHLLIAGTTGAGKSVALNSYITELVCYNYVNNLKVILIDLKQCEFNVFSKMAHLYCDIVTDATYAEQVLNFLIKEMERRYYILARQNLNSNGGQFSTILLVIDELSDLILQNENCKTLLIRLLQKARASDIHIICATQSPRAKVLDGVMLANLPSRICLTCSNVRESMLVLGHKGGETLTGKGDAIIKLNGSIKETRIQIPFISKEDIQSLIKH